MATTTSYYFLDLNLDGNTTAKIPSITNNFVEGTVKTPTAAHKGNQVLFGDNTWGGGASTEYIILDCGDADENV